MIRHYEKLGNIKPKREEYNNYRLYDARDIFWLMENIQLNKWGVEISDIASLRRDNYLSQTKDALEDKIKDLSLSISYDKLLLERIKELYNLYKFSNLNIGNFWIKEDEPYYSIDFSTGDKDRYRDVFIDDKISRILFDDKNIAFVDTGFSLIDDREVWKLILKESYVKRLKINLGDDFTYNKGQIVLLTNMDIGDFGDFNKSKFDRIFSYAKDKKIKIADTSSIFSLLIARGFENDNFQRLVQVRIPILSLE